MARTPGQPQWTDPGLLLLASLANGPKHGYAMTQDIERSFSVSLGPGTLYGALARLEERHLVEPLDGDQRRRPYRLTAQGAALLAQQTSEMRQFTAVTGSRLRSASVTPQ